MGGSLGGVSLWEDGRSWDGVSLWEDGWVLGWSEFVGGCVGFGIE